jgi:hypothetical protein
MFGFLDGFKYRADVRVQMHAILFYVPELKLLLKSFPQLKSGINQFRKEKISVAQAASSISLLVIERVMANIPMQTRALTLQQLKEHSDDEFRFFRRFGPRMEGTPDPFPDGMPILTLALGCSFWYLGCLVRDGQISRQARDIYVADVAGMLAGNSDADRFKQRLQIAMEA